MQKPFLAALVAATLTVKDVKGAVCWALCRQDSYDTGFYQPSTDECLCAVKKKYREITDKRLLVPNPRIPASEGYRED